MLGLKLAHIGRRGHWCVVDSSMRKNNFCTASRGFIYADLIMLYSNMGLNRPKHHTKNVEQIEICRNSVLY